MQHTGRPDVLLGWDSYQMILAVTGLSREARAIWRPHLAVAVGGGDSGVLRTRIERALDSGARRIISMGICGALDPSLSVGDCIVATEIVTEDECLVTHSSWTRELLTQVPAARPAALAGTDTILEDEAAKIRLHRATKAAAVDMESHVAARVAKERGLPFAAVRVVSDSAERALPPAALVGMSKNGGVDIGAVFRSLLAKPGQIPALMRTAWEAEKAFRVLFRCRHVLDPVLAPANLGELVLDVA
jgi:adenosylhomocysteine nucleosidase